MMVVGSGVASCPGTATPARHPKSKTNETELQHAVLITTKPTNPSPQANKNSDAPGFEHWQPLRLGCANSAPSSNPTTIAGSRPDVEEGVRLTRTAHHVARGSLTSGHRRTARRRTCRGR